MVRQVKFVVGCAPRVAISQLDPGSEESGADGCSADAEFVTDRQLRGASEVELLGILEKLAV
jgi:hypothetical protein